MDQSTSNNISDRDFSVSSSSSSSSSSSIQHPGFFSQNRGQRERRFNGRGNSHSNRNSQPRLRGNYGTTTVNFYTYWSNRFVNHGPFFDFLPQPLPHYNRSTPTQYHDWYRPYFNPSMQPPIMRPLPPLSPPQMPLDYLPINHPYFNDYSHINPYPDQYFLAPPPPRPPMQYYVNMQTAPPLAEPPRSTRQDIAAQNLCDPEADFREAIRKQIEYYFSEENLVKDRYLKSKMDEEGWVSGELIARFNMVARMTHNVELVLTAVMPSEVVEVQGRRMRRRGDWSRFVVREGQTSSTSSSTSPVEEVACDSETNGLIAGVQNIQLEPTENVE